MIFYLAHSIRKDLARFPVFTQSRILEKLEWLERQPHPLKMAKPLQGHTQLYRFRIGDYRVIVEQNGEMLVVLSIDKRDKAYKGY